MAARADATEATAERILDAAHRLFVKLPYDQVSIRAVAQQANVTVQTVIRRFEHKEGLLTAVVTRRSVEIRADRDQAPAGDAEHALRRLLESYECWGDEQLHLLGQEQRNKAIALAVDAGRRYHHAWVERVFGPHLVAVHGRLRVRRVAELVAVTDLYVWKVLRRDMNLSRPETETAMREMVERILRW